MDGLGLRGGKKVRKEKDKNQEFYPVFFIAGLDYM